MVVKPQCMVVNPSTYVYGSYTFSLKKANQTQNHKFSKNLKPYTPINYKFSRTTTHSVKTSLLTNCCVFDYFKMWDRRQLNHLRL